LAIFTVWRKGKGRKAGERIEGEVIKMRTKEEEANKQTNKHKQKGRQKTDHSFGGLLENGTKIDLPCIEIEVRVTGFADERNFVTLRMIGIRNRQIGGNGFRFFVS
jgi:hypothetical protein